jgi:gamma-glutamyltranspeptidase/glutathione hydrolase
MSPGRAERGVVAAGHEVTAEAGAAVLREGGNAVDAAVAAVLTSCVTESPLTGLGAGGYMLIHGAGEPVLLDFFVAVPGADGTRNRDELVPITIKFTEESSQVFHIGAASVGVPGTPAGLEEAARRFGTVALADLAAPAAALARDGVVLTKGQAYFIEILAPILTHYPECAAVYAPGGRLLREGDVWRFGELGDAIERLGSEGAAPFYRGEIAAALSAWVLERGGTLGRDDLAAYEPILRDPVRAQFAGREVFSNPPPASGGILIAFALELLARQGGEPGVEEEVLAMERAQAERTEEFLAGLTDPGFAGRFLDSSRLGSTTHITAVDGDGMCASVTCSNGSCSGVVVPGTGIDLNNMLGEQDLNPLGFHRHDAGRRLPSMMSPTVVVHDGELEAGLGSGGSNRIRSAILQTIVAMTTGGLDVVEAVNAPRVHFEDGAVQAEPGVDETALARLEERGYDVVRWRERNVFFGGVHAVSRNPATGELRGAGDPRRGGAVAVA